MAAHFTPIGCVGGRLFQFPHLVHPFYVREWMLRPPGTRETIGKTPISTGYYYSIAVKKR
jgi:hypothetical protein